MTIPSAALPAPANIPVTRREIPRFRHLLKLTLSYFVSREWPIAIGLVALILTLTYGHVRGFVATAEWQKSLFDMLEDRNAAALPGIVMQILLIYAWIVSIAVVQSFLTRYLSIRWRSWLTDRYLGRYLDGNRAYEIEQDAVVDNPDQRISEDIRLFTTSMLTLVTGFFNFLFGTVSYTLLLLKQSETIHLPVFGTSIPIPADLVVFAYTGMGLFYIAIYFATKPLVRRTMRLQKVEADFRFMLATVRRSAEQIAFLRAMRGEFHRLTASFARIRRTYIEWMWAAAGLQAVQGVLGSLTSEVMPVLVTLPRYFAGSMTLGDVAMSRQVFTSLLSSMSWPTQAAATLAEMAATVNRLHLLDEATARPDLTSISVERRTGIAAGAMGLSLTLPTGEPLLQVDQWRVGQGERWAIVGENGGGKSTLARALAGLWRHGHGEVSLDEHKAMFVPQKLYMPDGTLKEVLAFPHDAADYTDEEVLNAMAVVGMAGAAPGLHEYRRWGDALSPGQQQLAAFARIVLQKPSLLFLDEATSALDPVNAVAMYDVLRRELPDLTLISIVHNERLLTYHDHLLTISNGVASISTVAANKERP